MQIWASEDAWAQFWMGPTISHVGSPCLHWNHVRLLCGSQAAHGSPQLTENAFTNALTETGIHFVLVQYIEYILIHVFYISNTCF